MRRIGEPGNRERKGPFIFYEIGEAGGFGEGSPKKFGLKGGGASKRK